MRFIFYVLALVAYIVLMAFAFAAFDFWTLHYGLGEYAWWGDYRFVFNDVVSWLCPLGYGLAENVFYLFARWYHGWTGDWINPVGNWTFDWGGGNFYPYWKWYLSFGVRQVVWVVAVVGLWRGYGYKRRVVERQSGVGRATRRIARAD
jgi:hypothetical protein